MSANKNRYSFSEYLRSILSILVFFTLLLLLTPLILLMLIFSFGKLSSVVVEKIACPIARISLVVAGVTFRIKRYVNPVPSPAVYIINHGSTLDVLTLLALGLPNVRFVAKWQFQYNPLFFLLGRLTGQVFIRREQSEKAVNTLKKNVARITRQKLSILMAPEGSRKHEGVVGPFKKGPFRMALELNYPIVPIYLEGNAELSPGAFLITKKGAATAHIHPPIDTSGWNEEQLDKQIQQIRIMYLKWAGVDE
ncbi:MAG: lysophospholipid acyltransferase family protein [Balneolaceae bacterium]